MTTKTQILNTIESEPFTVYSSKDFPGILPRTQLSRAVSNVLIEQKFVDHIF